MSKLGALVRTWLLMDFFGDARQAGHGHSSSLTSTIFAQSFLAFVFAALLYPETPPVAFAAANLCLSSLLIAVGTLGDDSRPARRAIDEVLLGTAPLGRATVMLARTAHAAFYVVLVTIGMALPPGILLAYLRQDPLTALAYVASACACSGLAVGALAVLTRVALRCFGRNRTALLAGSLKALLLGAGLVMFALGLQRLQGTADSLPIGRLGAELLPPYQCARWLNAPMTEAWRLLPLAAVAAALLAIAALLAGNTERSTRSVGTNGPLSRGLQRLAGSGARLGIAEYVAVSMWRSAGFRARVLPLLGVPAGMVFLALQRQGGPNLVLTSLVLQLPAIYLPFLIAFLPRADQPGTGWVFAQAPNLTRELVQDATWRALVTHVLVPVHALAALLLATVVRDASAVAAGVFAFGLAVLAARFMVRGIEHVPFTHAREGDRGVDLGAAFAAGMVLGGLGAAFVLWLPPIGQWLLAASTVAMARWQLGIPATAIANPIAVAVEAAAEPGESTEPASSQPDPAAEPRDAAPIRPTLRRELRAIATLYASGSVLPWLVGTMFAA